MILSHSEVLLTYTYPFCFSQVQILCLVVAYFLFSNMLLQTSKVSGTRLHSLKWWCSLLTLSSFLCYGKVRRRRNGSSLKRMGSFSSLFGAFYRKKKKKKPNHLKLESRVPCFSLCCPAFLRENNYS